MTAIMTLAATAKLFCTGAFAQPSRITLCYLTADPDKVQAATVHRQDALASDRECQQPT
jgi:hypothetical protein